MKKAKITVLRKLFYADLAERYLTGGADAGACPLRHWPGNVIDKIFCCRAAPAMAGELYLLLP
jgi:hypothetical protein